MKILSYRLWVLFVLVNFFGLVGFCLVFLVVEVSLMPSCALVCFFFAVFLVLLILLLEWCYDNSIY